MNPAFAMLDDLGAAAARSRRTARTRAALRLRGELLRRLVRIHAAASVAQWDGELLIRHLMALEHFGRTLGLPTDVVDVANLLAAVLTIIDGRKRCGMDAVVESLMSFWMEEP